ncbi:MAG TPA: alpha/beta fold hydrolase [Bryobacteraceae bacterium]|nr:alpha/beta fold hydrolase [Bryobacteraceae bacterium]
MRFRFRRFVSAAAVLMFAPVAAMANPGAQPQSLAEIQVEIPSTEDGARQPALLYVPPGGSRPAVPLLVFLHSWSADYRTSEALKEALDECRERGWAFLSPDFRGPNNRPEACASKLAVQDVLDAVAFARKRARIDGRRIYLLGGSGGGHMALIMSSRAPRTWAAVSAWVPITNLAAWYASSKASGTRYYRMLEQCCGGAPGTPGTALEYRARSPLFSLARARSVRIAIDAGIRDGHEGSVPITHSLLAFNELARANGFEGRMLSPGEIDEFTASARVPQSLRGEVEDERGRKHKVLFRRTAGPVRLTIFDGAHTIDVRTGVNWLASTPLPKPGRR